MTESVDECDGNPCGLSQGCLDNLRESLNDFVCVCTNVTKTAIGKPAVCKDDDEAIAQWLVVTLAISGVFICLAMLVFLRYFYQIRKMDALYEANDLEAQNQRVNSAEFSSGGSGGSNQSDP
eukprot:TRINITY_DN763_c0_g4_i1.p1 TRINITY_DN763_c0_g4~~TRINITY_DN763_c0_g4_i1.p1  ORF type:complete len:135 (+),score=22.87 TRINITY_DN763_c0_g4_i1:40-405(+)